MSKLSLVLVLLLWGRSSGFRRGASARLAWRLGSSQADDAAVIAALQESQQPPQEKLSVAAVFSALASSDAFLKSVWQQRPFLCASPLACVEQAFKMEDVQRAVDGDFIEAGRGTPIPGGGWNMASVSQPRGSSFEDAKLRFQDVQVAMKQTAGTVVFNSAGGFIPPLAGVCLETVGAFGLPAALNMYLTNPGQQLSAPPHTDRQDVFVLHTQGQKRWRVFAPPAPAARPKSDPFTRGKGKDELSLSELGEPLVDVVLSPGHVLYVPAGFPHTTDTLEGVTNTQDASVHLTVGIDTHVWGLSFAGLRAYALRRAGLDHELPVAKVGAAEYWALQDSLPLGFLSEEITHEHRGFGTAMRRALSSEIISRLISRMRAAEPDRWPASLSDQDMILQIGAEEATERLILHQGAVTEILRKMYADVAFKMTPAKFDLSFFRSQPYFQQLETAMVQLETWASPKNKAAEAGKSKGFGGGGAGADALKALKEKTQAKAKGFR